MPEFEGQGVGSSAYDLIEAARGRPLAPSPLGLSAEATALWMRRLASRPDARALVEGSRDVGRAMVGQGLEGMSPGLRAEKLAARMVHVDARLAPFGPLTDARALPDGPLSPLMGGPYSIADLPPSPAQTGIFRAPRRR